MASFFFHSDRLSSFWFLVSGLGFWFLVSGFSFLIGDRLMNHKPETRNQKPETSTRCNVRNRTRPHCIIISPCENNLTRDHQRFYEQKGKMGALRLNPWSDTLFIFAAHRYSSYSSRRLD